MNLLLRLYLKRTLTILLVLLIISLIYFFYQPGVTVFNNNIANPVYPHVEDLKLWLYFVVCFIAVTLIFFSILFLLSIYYDYKRERNARLTSGYEKYFAEKLSEYLLSEKYNDKHERDAFVRSVKPYTVKWIQIDALFSIYTRIQEAVTINFSSKFILLLKDLGLYDKQKKLLYSISNVQRIIAMKMLSYLRINDYNDRILYYTKSKNHALRTEADAALVRLMGNTDTGLSFIEQKYTLSLLDINVLVNAVLKNFKTDIDYEGLLTSNYVSKKIVGALLIKDRKLKEYKHLLFQKPYTVTQNLLLRQTIWDSFLELADESETVHAVMRDFENEPDEVKMLILEKLHQIKDVRFKEFLAKIAERQSLLVKIEILKILFNNDIKRFISFKDSKDSELRKAFNEVTDMNIN